MTNTERIKALEAEVARLETRVRILEGKLAEFMAALTGGGV